MIDLKKQTQAQISKQIELQEYETEAAALQTPQDNEYEETLSNSFNNEQNLLENLNKETEALRSKPRPISLFKFYPQQQQADQLCVEYKMLPIPPQEPPTTKFLVKCSQLKFELEIEPIWATMALYDLKEKRKISENFAFDLNTESIKHMLNTYQTHQDLSTTAKSCIFNLTHSSPEIYLVIRVEKVLQQGDISECAESYVKPQSLSQIEKLQINASQFCERLGKFRMPFVWTAVNIMSILSKSAAEETTIKSSSLDRRQPGNQSTLINYMNENDEADEEFLTAASKPSVLKNAYENFKRTNKCSKQNSFRSSLDDESHLHKFKPIAITVNTFFKQENDKLADEDLYRFLNDLKKPTNLIKKLKCVPGTLKMEFSPFEHDFLNATDLATVYASNFFLSPELELIKQSNIGIDKNKQQQNHYHQPLFMHHHLLPVKDILEFPSKPVYAANYYYRNLLYVYPVSINLNNLIRSGVATNVSASIISNQQSSSARNIAIKLNLMKGEEEHCALPVIFAKSSSTLEYHKEVYANVVYHNRTPQYHDEIKIKLPALLNEPNSNYHLLFTFYHVSCQSTKDQNQLESIIGYSWLPLQQQFQFESSVETNPDEPNIPNRCTMIKNGTYSLPICLEKLPTGYSSLNYSIYTPNESNSVKSEEQQGDFDQNELDADLVNDQSVSTTITNVNSSQVNNSISMSKSYFDLRINLVSTIHTQDVYLERLNQVTSSPSIDLSLLRRSIHELHLADSEALIKFLFVILDKLFHLMVQIPSISQMCLEAVSRLVLKVTNLLPGHSDSHKRNRLLVQYIKYACNLPLDYIETQYLFHEHLINELIGYLSTKQQTKSASRDLVLNTLWFYLEILFKATSFYLNRSTNQFRMFKSKQQINKSFNSFCTKFFSQKFLNDLEILTNLITNELIDSKQSQTRERTLNCSLAFFLADLFSFLDRGFIFRLVEHYFKETNKILLSISNQLNDKQLNLTNLIAKYKQIHLGQLDFLRIITSNEHYLALNLPFFSSNLLEQIQTRPKLVVETNEFFSKHYLVGLVLRQIFKSLHSSVPAIQSKAVQLLRNLIEAHDLDPRLDNPKLRVNTACMYLPFVNLFIHFIPIMLKRANKCKQQNDVFLFKDTPSGKKNDLNDLGYLLSDVMLEPELDLSNDALISGEFDDDLVLTYENEEEGDADAAADLNETENFIDDFLNEDDSDAAKLKSNNTSFLKNSNNRKSNMMDKRSASKGGTITASQQPVKMKPKEHKPKYSCCDFYMHRLNKLNDTQENGMLSLETTQDLLICFIWILKNVGNELLFKIWTRWPSVKIKKILALVDLSINHFEFKSEFGGNFLKKISLSSIVAAKTLITKSKFLSRIKRNEFVKNSKYSTDTNGLIIYDVNDLSDQAVDTTRLEANLSTECCLVLLDTLELLIELIQYQNTLPNLKSFISKSSLDSSCLSQHYLLKCVMKVLLNALSTQPSIRTLPNLFCLQREFVSKFCDLLFEADTDYCSDMCTLLLKHCTSQLSGVRSQASASMYFLMRQNFDIGNNFARVKQQLTMSLSTLVTGIGQSAEQKLTDLTNINALKSSLKLILVYADTDAELIESSFPSQVKDLIINLNTILSDTVKMREYSDDHDMILDLMHRIANCYQNSPDMRLIWLQNMAQKHLERQNLVEAGQCLVHAAALIAEYLSMIENKSYLPIGCASFKNVSINVLEESAISDDVVIHSSLDGLCTGKYFTETGLIGLIEQAAVFLVHSQNYEASNQLYKILIPIYEHHRDIKKLSQVHSKLHDCFNKILVNGTRRLFGTYFRVGFYGDAFNELNGEEFIYKEPGITKLAEIAHRLENYYTEKFGDGCVEIMKDSNNVDKKQLDLVSKAYIQITYVEPYFDRWESQKCVTFFEKNYSLSKQKLLYI